MASVVELKVAMMCNGCKGAVERVATKIEGVDKVDVDLETQKVVITGSNLNKEAVFEKIAKTGKATEYWPQ